MDNTLRKNKLIYSRFIVNAGVCLVLGISTQSGNTGFFPEESAPVLYLGTLVSLIFAYVFYRRSGFADTRKINMGLYKKYEQYTLIAYTVSGSALVAGLIQLGSRIPNYRFLMFLVVIFLASYILSMVFRIRAITEINKKA